MIGSRDLRYEVTHQSPFTSIHGDRTQPEREEALRSVRSGPTPILFATDIVAQGLDVLNVTHEINSDFPSDIADYVHRIGWTSRAGSNGLAIAFINERNWTVLRDLWNVTPRIATGISPFVEIITTFSLGRAGGGEGRNRGRSGGKDYSEQGGGTGSRSHQAGGGYSVGGYGKGENGESYSGMNYGGCGK